MQKQSKSQILKQYLANNPHPDSKILEQLKKKPIRSLSGITPVTALTKPYPCPGQCIFCPNDPAMPKSYIASEPGAQRAYQHQFDPYNQVYHRLQAYTEIGHPVSKIELIVLGGTWSAYPETYQLWFITRMFQALNDFHPNQPPSSTSTQEAATWDELNLAHQYNQTAACRCVGLVLETRPDRLNQTEVIRLRRLGATKIQLGIQSLSDSVLALNQRGHTLAATEAAIDRLRQAGFKIHAHWMPNLYGSNPTLDITDFDQLFSNPHIFPDELKVYPCSLIPNTPLVDLYHQGKWRPYTQEELTLVLTHVLTYTPQYCRLTRIIRDIPGAEILVGNKTTNFRQLLEAKIDPTTLHDIRAREIRGRTIDPSQLQLDDQVYQTAVSTEHFLQYVTKDNKIAAFLRLSLPTVDSFIPELQGAAIIREVHVYGQAIDIGVNATIQTQHQGLGKKLITQSINLAKQAQYSGISVISAVGTRKYYQKLGFTAGALYQHQAF